MPPVKDHSKVATHRNYDTDVMVQEDSAMKKGSIKSLKDYKSPALGRSKGLDLNEASFIKRALSGEFKKFSESDFKTQAEKLLFRKYRTKSRLQLKTKFLSLTKA